MNTQKTNKVKSHPLYNTWRALRQRCDRKNHQDYIYYGARGITYDPSWSNFKTFLEDMGPKPTPSHSLDRIDNSKGYSKQNCRWATVRQQANNKRVSLFCYKGHPWTKESTMHTHNGIRPTRRCKICYEARLARKGKT